MTIEILLINKENNFMISSSFSRISQISAFTPSIPISSEAYFSYQSGDQYSQKSDAFLVTMSFRLIFILFPSALLDWMAGNYLGRLSRIIFFPVRK